MTLSPNGHLLAKLPISGNTIVTLPLDFSRLSLRWSLILQLAGGAPQKAAWPDFCVQHKVYGVINKEGRSKKHSDPVKQNEMKILTITRLFFHI